MRENKIIHRQPTVIRTAEDTLIGRQIGISFEFYRLVSPPTETKFFEENYGNYGVYVSQLLEVLFTIDWCPHKHKAKDYVAYVP